MTMAKVFGAAIRNLRRAPAFTGLVVLTLALGIGAATAMFSVVDAVLLRPLPYPGVERFRQIWTDRSGSTSPGVSGAAFAGLRTELAGVAELEGYKIASATITGGSEPDIVLAPFISPRLLALVGATPHLGRLFTADDARSAAPVAIISHAVWLAKFGGATDTIGRLLEIDEQPHTIIGVMSPGSLFPQANTSIWRPLDLDAAQPARSRVMAIAVRDAALTPEFFESRLRIASANLQRAGSLPEGHSVYGDTLLQARFGRSNARGYWLLFGAVIMVLLVACVNVGNLMLSRAQSQRVEYALRAALGAGRMQLLSAAFTECVLLAAASGLVAVLVAKSLLAILLAILPPQFTYLSANAASLDVRVLIFAALVSLVACLMSAFLPAVRSSQADPIDAIKAETPAATRGDDLWQGILIAAQTAAVLVLLAGAGLLLRSFLRLSAVETGIDAKQFAAVDIALTSTRYSRAGAAREFLEELERRLEATGQLKMTHAAGTPVTAPAVYLNVTPEAEGGTAVDFAGQMLPYVEVAPDYFETLGIAMLAGRSFLPTDPEHAIVINDKLAARYWPGESPLGKRFRPNRDEPWFTVIGVVADVRQMALNDPAKHGMEMYRRQSPRQAGGFYSIVIHAPHDPDAAVGTIKQAVTLLDARVPMLDASTLTARFDKSLYYQRFFVRVSTAFTLIALTLACLGIYAAFTHWVIRRRRELAIRMAIGASPARLWRAVMRRGMGLAAAGGTIGLLLALAGSQMLSSMLFEIESHDPATLTGAVLLLLITSAAASTVPALRASRVDPMTTLRAE